MLTSKCDKQTLKVCHTDVKRLSNFHQYAQLTWTPVPVKVVFNNKRQIIPALIYMCVCGAYVGGPRQLGPLSPPFGPNCVL